jgi:hypothetical protein
MTAVAALTFGLLLIIALGALIAVLIGVPLLAIVLGTAVATAAAFYLITNSLLKRRDVEKKPASTPASAVQEGDHIS